MAEYIDDFLEEDDDEIEKDCEILIDLRKIAEDEDDIESFYEDEDDEIEDICF